MTKTKEKGFNTALIASVVLHLLVIGLFLFGIPSFYEKLPDEKQVITFEMLPLSDVVNVKNQTPKQPKVEEVERAKKVPKTKPEEPEKKPEMKEETKEEPKPEKTEPQVEEEKKLEPEKSKDAEPIPEEKAPAKPLKKKEEKKEEKKPLKKITVPKQEEKKKEKPKLKPKLDDSIDNLLKNLEEASEGDVTNSNKIARKTSTDEGKFAKSDDYSEDLPLSMNETTLIIQQIERNWHQQRFIGIPKISEVIISIIIDLDSSGRVIAVKVDNANSHCPPGMADICENVKESVLQAIWNSSPFQKLDPNRYKDWKKAHPNFSPRL